MKRFGIVALALLTGCNGMGGAAAPFLPPPSAGAGTAAGPQVGRSRSGVRVKVNVTLTVPRRRRGERANTEHPATISSATQSVGISMNGGAQQTFNVTPSSPACTIVANNTVCRFTPDSPTGSVSMAVATYAGSGGTGIMLDRGVAVVTIARGKANAPSIVLGPVVSTTADSGPGSLRYAVGGANRGDTIMFVVANGSKIVLSHPIAIANNLSIAGPGVSSGDTISAGNASQLFVVGNDATASISGLILTQGKATVAQQPGGAISNQGTLSLAGDAFLANGSTAQSPLLVRAPRNGTLAEKRRHRRHPNCTTTYNDGGAIYNNGSLAISGSTFSGNVLDSAPGCLLSRGGAIYNDRYGTLSVEGSVFSGNAAYYGGAVYNNSTYGQAAFTNDTFSGNLGCTAATGCPYGGGDAAGYGGAINDNDGPGITIAGSAFTQNVTGGNSQQSSGQGGALQLTTGAPVITSSVFSANVAGGGLAPCASGEGGAIEVDAPSLEIDGDTFANNTAGGDATGYGGAIFASGSLRGTNDSFTSNSAYATGSACAANAYGFGGAIYASANSIALTSSTFKSNTASASYEAEGGAIYMTTGALTSAHDTFTSNAATVTSASAADVEGGAIYDSGSTLASTYDSFSSNSAAGRLGFPTAWGGAVSAATPCAIRNDTFAGNSANSPDQSFGGAIYSNAVDNTIYASTFTSNVASGKAGLGGAVYAGQPLTISGSTLSGNSASFAGGGLFANSPTDVQASLFSANVVTGAGQYGGGGGIYLDAVSTIENSTLTGNSVTVTNPQTGGGGVSNFGGMTLTGSTISGNHVLGAIAGSGGGGIFNDDGAVILDSTITGNISAGDGGGIEAVEPAATVSVALINVTLYQNTAAASGGNINNAYQLILANSIVAGGTAAAGPDIANTGTVTSGDYNVIGTPVTIAGTTTHDEQADPQLLALANNGGPTLTNAEHITSPGRAMIPYSGGCGFGGGPSTDQRGFTRGAGGFCDAGAYEFSGVPGAARHHEAIAPRGDARARRARPLRIPPAL